MKQLHPRIVCKNGFSVSVQANKYAYCSPRQDIGPYSEVELGFPEINGKEINWPDYLEEYSEGHICPYVPVELVEKLISENGGISIGRTI